MFGLVPPPGTDDEANDTELLAEPKQPHPPRTKADASSQATDVKTERAVSSPIAQSTPRQPAPERNTGYNPPHDPRSAATPTSDPSYIAPASVPPTPNTEQYNVIPEEEWWEDAHNRLAEQERKRHVRFRNDRSHSPKCRSDLYRCDHGQRDLDDDECGRTIGQYRQATPMPRRYRSSTGSCSDDCAYRSFIEDFSLLSGTDADDTPSPKCLVKPKKFTGVNWPGDRLHFLSVAQANGWNPAESARVLKACLNEDAALVLRRSLRHKDATLEQIFRCLDERYLVSGPDYVLRGKIRRTVQKHDQSVDAFQVELMALMANRADAE